MSGMLDYWPSRTGGTRVYRTELGVKPELLGYHCDLCRNVVPSVKTITIDKNGAKHMRKVRKSVCKACEIKHTHTI